MDTQTEKQSGIAIATKHLCPKGRLFNKRNKDHKRSPLEKRMIREEKKRERKEKKKQEEEPEARSRSRSRQNKKLKDDSDRNCVMAPLLSSADKTEETGSDGCSQQIHLPPELPNMLKQFTKAAFRTQQKDVLASSALENNEISPFKEHVEMAASAKKIDTAEFKLRLIRILHLQLCAEKVVSLGLIWKNWNELTLPKELFVKVVEIGHFTRYVTWLHFLAVTCRHLSNARDIFDAMKVLCEILSNDPDGGKARIPFALFRDLYKYLAEVEGDVSEAHVDTVLEQLQWLAEHQNGDIYVCNIEIGDKEIREAGKELELKLSANKEVKDDDEDENDDSTIVFKGNHNQPIIFQGNSIDLRTEGTFKIK